jgi:glycosyltransferase involved in cell wall biosynthesis
VRILFLSRWYPYPADNGSKLRIFSLIKGLSAQHDLVLISFFDPADGDPRQEELSAYCTEVIPLPYREFQPASLDARLGFFSPTPRSVINTYSPAVEKTIREVLSRQKIDLVIASQFDMAVYAPVFSHLPAIFEEVETGIYLNRVQSAPSIQGKIRHGMTYWKHRRYLRYLLSNFDLCTVVSEQEKSLLGSLGIELTKVWVVPNCVDMADYSTIQPEPERERLIFTGSFRYQPNYEAMCWFVGEVLPLIQHTLPETRLVITGDHAGRKLPEVPNVLLTGHLPDIRQEIANSWISVAPILSGGGTRIKILEAMALGTPVVATSKGVEGLAFQANQQLKIADTPDDFAAACIQILESPVLRQRLATNARDKLEKEYTWPAVLPGFVDLIEQLPFQRLKA